MSAPTVRWAALAIAGLLVVASITLAISRLISQPIGLASEPVAAGRQLAPRTTSAQPGRTAPAVTVLPPTTATAPATTVAPPSGDNHPHDDGGTRPQGSGDGDADADD